MTDLASEKKGEREPPKPHPLRGPWKNQSKRHYPAPHHIFSTKATKCNESLMRYWMCSSFIHAWNLNNTSVRVSLRVIKCSFQNYGIPGHVIWILNKKITTICNVLQHKQFQSELFANNNKENIGSQKLRNYWVAMSSSAFFVKPGVFQRKFLLKYLVYRGENFADKWHCYALSISDIWFYWLHQIIISIC